MDPPLKKMNPEPLGLGIRPLAGRGGSLRANNTYEKWAQLENGEK